MLSEIVLIGGSAGSVQVLTEIVRGLPVDFAAPIFMLSHSAPRERSRLPEILTRFGRLPAHQVQDGERSNRDTFTFAAPDRHLMIAEDHVHLARGPKEGLQRPSINVAFRSAATTYRERVIGVLLSGMLDDGASGIWKRRILPGFKLERSATLSVTPAMPVTGGR